MAKIWTVREEKYVREQWDSCSVTEISKALGRSGDSVRQHARKQMGLPRNKNSCSRRAIYAFYEGDEYVCEGTADELAERLGIERSTVQWYAFASIAKNRAGGRHCIRVGETNESRCKAACRKAFGA